MRYGESALSLLGLAVTLLAWIVPQDRIGYEVKFTLLGIGLTIICLGLGLLVRGWWRGRGKQEAIDQLSEAISLAIRELVNMPRPGPGLVNETAFADKLTKEYLAWCEGVDKVLADRRHFTRSDLLHFQRLGFIQPVHLTGHPGADHTLAMLNLKMQRLREVIAWNR